MATDDTIRIAYNLKNMRLNQAMSGVAALLFAVFAGLCVLVIPYAAHDWSMGATFVIGIPLCVFCVYFSFREWRFYYRNGRVGQSAFVVTMDGVEEYASEMRVGAIAWDEIEHIYPWESPQRRFNLLLRQRRYLVIRFKTNDYLQRTGRKFAFYQTPKFRHMQSQYLLIPEALLSAPTPEIMLRLNRFYLDNVAPETQAE